MAQKQIVWSKIAEEELRFVLEFYTLRNGNINYSLKLLQQIEEVVALLPKNNFLGRLSDNSVTRV